MTDPDITWHQELEYATILLPNSTEYVAFFDVYEVIGTGTEDGRATFEGGEDDIYKAEREMQITVKWDGCMDIEHDVCPHFCTASDIDRQCDLFKVVREEASNVLSPNWQGHERRPPRKGKPDAAIS